MAINTIIMRAKGFPDLVVDRTRGTLLNTNRNRLLMYKRQRDESVRNMNNASRIENLEEQIKSLQAIVDNLIKPVTYNAK